MSILHKKTQSNPILSRYPNRDWKFHRTLAHLSTFINSDVDPSKTYDLFVFIYFNLKRIETKWLHQQTTGIIQYPEDPSPKHEDRLSGYYGPCFEWYLNFPSFYRPYLEDSIEEFARSNNTLKSKRKKNDYKELLSGSVSHARDELIKEQIEYIWSNIEAYKTNGDQLEYARKMFLLEQNPNWLVFAYQCKNDFDWGNNGAQVMFRVFNLFTSDLDKILIMVAPDQSDCGPLSPDLHAHHQINGNFLYYKSTKQYNSPEGIHVVKLDSFRLDSGASLSDYPTTYWEINPPRNALKAHQIILSDEFLSREIKTALLKQDQAECCLTNDYRPKGRLKFDAIKLNTNTHAFDKRFTNRTVSVNHEGKKILFNSEKKVSKIFSDYLLKYPDKIVFGVRSTAHEFEEFIIIVIDLEFDYDEKFERNWNDSKMGMISKFAILEVKIVNQFLIKQYDQKLRSYIDPPPPDKP